MPGTLSGRKRNIIAVSDEEDVSDVSRSSTPGKRARRSGDASQSHLRTANLQALNEDDEKELHQPGSLVRVKLTNFVTYTAAEFHLGPSLNMIIGPNGTGKSTLVCAICLGLGWSPMNLGRAKEIGEFVKHGNAEAEIEIELAASPDQRENPVIRRVIRKEGNKSAFFINQRPKAQKDVLALARSFSIQIDNLCQFLPQDRVVEFARLDPISLLRETQRAAAPEIMVQQHDELKVLRKTEKELEVTQKNDQHHLSGLQAKQNTTREDVDRYNQRQELLTKSKALEKCRTIIAARILRAETAQLQQDIDTNKEELEQYQAEVEPARRAEAETEVYRDQVEQVVRNRKQLFSGYKDTVDRIASKFDQLNQSLGEHVTEINAERQKEKQRRQDMKRVEGEINRLRRSMEDNVVEYDATPFNTRKSEIRAKKALAERKLNEKSSELTTIRQGVGRARELLQDKTNERARLDTQTGQQVVQLTKLSRDTATAWQWLEENMSQLDLKDKIYGPPIMTCSIPDKKYADAVESQLRPGDLTAFTCTNQEDAQLIQNKLLGSQSQGGLGLHSIAIRTILKPRSAYQPPMQHEELPNFGFEGWISDFIEGPDPVLAMLCDGAKLHRTAFTSQSISNQQYGALERDDRIGKWVSGNEVFQITKRREYGVSSTSVNPLKKAQYFSGNSGATTEMTQLDEKLKELHQDVAQKKEVYEQVLGEARVAKQEVEEADQERQEVQEEQDQLQRAHAEWQGLPRKIAKKEDDLSSIKKESDETHNRIKGHQIEHEQTSLKVASQALLYAKAATHLRSLHESYIEAEIRLIEAKSEVAAFQNDNRQILEALEERRTAIEHLKAEHHQKKSEAKRMVRLVKNTYDNLEEGPEKELVREYNQLETMEALEEEISSVESRLVLMTEADPHAVKAFEDREQKIQRVQATLAEVEENLTHTRNEIARIRAEWEPELDALVSKISDGFAHNFAQIGCAGEVSVDKDDDFENWSIQIRVRFREGENLSVLDSHRQSGGERAVSTIFYLMALQDLARSPFRVVDEINQGMDPRNERMVHERMVDIACRERTSQYFLITPKLLNGLKFHPKMTVHCIASGEHMPGDDMDLDFGRLAKLAMRVRGKQVSAT